MKAQSISARDPFVFSFILLGSYSPPEDFCFILVVVGGWGATFWFFKSLDTNMVYISGIYIYMYTKEIRAEKKSYGF